MPLSLWPLRKRRDGDPKISAPYDALNFKPERSKSLNEIARENVRGSSANYPPVQDPRASWHEGAAAIHHQQNNYYNRMAMDFFEAQSRAESSGTSTRQRGSSISKMIEKHIHSDKRNTFSSEFYRILILGPENSGKTTMSKQLNIIYNQCFSKETQTMPYAYRIREVLYGVCVESCNVILQSQPTSVPSELRNFAKDLLSESAFNVERSAAIVRKMKRLWKNPSFLDYVKLLKRELRYEELYFIHEWKRILKKGFIPTQMDVIYCHDRSGTIETDLFFGKLDFRLTDIGEKSYSKALRQMDNVSTIIYTVPLDEWDVKCEEPSLGSRSSSFAGNGTGAPGALNTRPKTISREFNKMDLNLLSHIDPNTKMFYALEGFSDVCTEWFPNTSIVLYFTKEDLFREKIAMKNAKAGTEVFDAEKLIKGFTRKFEDTFTDSIQLGSKKLLNVHIINALNPVEVAKKFEFQQVKEFLILDWAQKKKNNSNTTPHRTLSFHET
eukprot:TRINITY_DN471_c0_g1_i2.p1 TRINITY_DN471_c0_g1~~TRINITY_DN471_c0_g1_i2.p1  ORF type:complete len:497 (-),score=153.74 TRINITY_DN471_c0_g1_i2:125-1615(-)